MGVMRRTPKDTAGRDVVARSIMIEIRAKVAAVMVRGAARKLKLDHWVKRCWNLPAGYHGAVAFAHIVGR